MNSIEDFFAQPEIKLVNLSKVRSHLKILNFFIHRFTMMTSPQKMRR
ncbi:hypothetical protein [Spirulina major]|nr:hypothetical protein [Spirulina major]